MAEYLRSPCYIYFWPQPSLAPGQRIIRHLQIDILQCVQYYNANKNPSELTFEVSKNCEIAYKSAQLKAHLYDP